MKFLLFVLMTINGHTFGQYGYFPDKESCERAQRHYMMSQQAMITTACFEVPK